MKITIENTLMESDAEYKNKDLVQTERQRGVHVNYKRFNFILKNDAELIGHIDAYTAFSEVYIDDIWIHSNHRGGGCGKKLLAHLEDHFEGQGFNNINLVTSEFSAPKFYEKCGFKLEFIRENVVNPRFTKYFYIKFFKNEIQTQGLAL